MPEVSTDPYSISEIDRFSNALADLAETSSTATPIPTCGDWTLGDLVWHLTEVQDFWSYIISHRPAGYEGYDQPPRGTDAQLGADLRAACARLLGALDGCSPDEHAWSWAEEQTVGFTIRRQTHEALVHCVDGLLAVGNGLPLVSPALAADGVDEVLSVMLYGSSQASGFELTSHTMRIQTTDTADSWDFALGHRGDQPAVQLRESATVPYTICEGAALDLNLWLWGRNPTEPHLVAGNTDLLGQLRTLVASETI